MKQSNRFAFIAEHRGGPLTKTTHAVARKAVDPVYKAVARSIGQAVATAHMADHSLGGAFYALKALKLAKKDIEKEKHWQTERLHELPK